MAATHFTFPAGPAYSTFPSETSRKGLRHSQDARVRHPSHREAPTRGVTLQGWDLGRPQGAQGRSGLSPADPVSPAGGGVPAGPARFPTRNLHGMLRPRREKSAAVSPSRAVGIREEVGGEESRLPAGAAQGFGHDELPAGSLQER